MWVRKNPRDSSEDLSQLGHRYLHDWGGEVMPGIYFGAWVGRGGEGAFTRFGHMAAVALTPGVWWVWLWVGGVGWVMVMHDLATRQLHMPAVGLTNNINRGNQKPVRRRVSSIPSPLPNQQSPR